MEKQQSVPFWRHCKHRPDHVDFDEWSYGHFVLHYGRPTDVATSALTRRVRSAGLGARKLRLLRRRRLVARRSPAVRNACSRSSRSARDAVTRGTAAGSLWPDASGDHAGSSLRSALSRLGPTRDAVAATDIDLRLADDVAVDIRESQGSRSRPPRAPTLVTESASSARRRSRRLSRDLLPDWYDDWLIPEAEEWRQLRLHALEALSDRLANAGRCAHAMGAALAAVRVDPLRESATAALIRVHLREGNQADALREFRRYRALLQRELGVEPTTNLFELVGVAPMASRRAADTRGDRPSGPRSASPSALLNSRGPAAVKRVPGGSTAQGAGSSQRSA